jgi:hypothetical protein
MKKFLTLLFPCIGFWACTSSSNQDAAKSDSASKKEALVYPFTAKYSLNWQPGDEKNAVMVLNAFKKYTDGDVKGSFVYFGDSVEFIADKFHFKGKKDSLEAIMIPMRSAIASMTLQPDAWITVYYPDQKDTWVTVWSTQTWTDKKGKMDSIYLVDDVLVKNGKIAQIDEKQRMFPEPKKN